jgi:hypothetical protein
MHALCGIPTTKHSGVVQWRNEMAEPEPTMESVDPVHTVLAYADKLAKAGENDGSLFMFDLAIPELERLVLNQGQHDRLKTLAMALVTKGTFLSRLGQDATAQALFQRANKLMADADRSKNATVRWALRYFDGATEEELAAQHVSAATLFGEAVALLEKSPDDPGSYLPKALVGQATALSHLGMFNLVPVLCNRAVSILEPECIHDASALTSVLATANSLLAEADREIGNT